MDFVALGAIAGVGFTVSLLMAQLAFADKPQILAEATIAVVIGSLVSMAFGAIIAQRRGKHYQRLARNS
jgi:NhaA family Na+:H+ antiporter